MADNLSITVKVPMDDTVERLWPLMESGVREGVVSVDQAVELIEEAIIEGIEVDRG